MENLLETLRTTSMILVIVSSVNTFGHIITRPVPHPILMPFSAEWIWFAVVMLATMNRPHPTSLVGWSLSVINGNIPTRTCFRSFVARGRPC